MPSSVRPESLTPTVELSGGLAGTLHRLRRAAQRRAAARAPTERISRAVAEACRRVTSTPQGGATIAEIARRRGWQDVSLRRSLAALCKPMTCQQQLENFASDFPAGRGVIGLIMAGNIPGAGLHELVAALVTGWSVVVKVASCEPLFFAVLRSELIQADSALAARLAVLRWPRELTELTAAMRRDCDRIAVFGDDETVANIAHERDAGFGDRVSFSVIDPQHTRGEIASRVAWDVSLFEQCGCLSPHHVFVLERVSGEARAFAAALAQEMEVLALRVLPPAAHIPAETAGQIRSEQERARWRGAAGGPVTLWTGKAPGWSVIHDGDASFTRSPGHRTVFVSPFLDEMDLARRLAPFAGRLEACALDARSAAIREVIEAAGATYVCKPGEIQSPPLDWKHGGGAFHRLLKS